MFFTDNKNVYKETIIFLHGFFMDSRMFKHQAEYFEENYRVICCDFRGFGKTEWCKSSFTLEELANDILNLINHLNISSCIVAGMSMGGYVAQRMALLNPELISNIIFIATQASRDNPETIESYHQLRDNWSNTVIREQIIDSLLPVIIGGNEDESLFWKSIWQSYHPNNIYHAMTAMTSRQDINVAQIKVPCLVIHGSNDVGIPLSAGEKLHSDLPYSKMVVVDGACHAVNLTHPNKVNEAIETFLYSQLR
ncbi:alpha/beta fold hydrolase [Vibrio sagamiensis]|nr:alpha/beta hydrolase [Vibrio sagamiensis]PNQ53916.1 alpha/beta hydrolase [Vibrio agarivorans]